MPRHGGSYEQTRKQRKRRTRNGQSYRDKKGVLPERCWMCRIHVENAAVLSTHLRLVHNFPKEQDQVV